ncbi:unnamed protein product [Sphagnum balticum]
MPKKCWVFFAELRSKYGKSAAKDAAKDIVSWLRVNVPSVDYVFGFDSAAEKIAELVGASFIPVALEDCADFGASFSLGYKATCQAPADKVKRVLHFWTRINGKSTLTKNLALHFGTQAVPEWARHMLNYKNNELVESDLILFARGQCASEDALALQSSKRYLPEKRKEFFEYCIAELTRRKRSFTVINGDWQQRFIKAERAIRTDLYVAEGKLPGRDRVILGHEFSGTVVESASAEIKVGLRVAVNPLTSCRVCRHCSVLPAVACQQTSFLGLDEDGCFAEFIRVPAASVHKIDCQCFVFARCVRRASSCIIGCFQNWNSADRVWSHNWQSVDREKLAIAVSRLNHRGPDAQRVWTNDSGSVALAHARLAIIAIDEPPQPVTNEDGTIAAIVNVPVRQSDIINHLEDAVYYSEGLAVNGHLSAKFLLHKAVHKAGFRVTLSEMASSVEGRVPFLDHNLFESAKMLPVSAKIKDGTEKFVLREAVREFVTDEIYKREKHPFVAPPLSRFSDESSHQLLLERLEDASTLSSPFFDRKNLTQLQSRLKNAGTEERCAYDPVFMTILSTAALASKNFEIIGVDLCERYIKIANEKSRAANLSAKFFADDAFSFKTNTLCDAAFNWWTSFGYSDSDDKNLEMLKRAADSLRSGARFALDIPNAEFIRAKKNTSDVSSIETAMGTVSILRDTELQLDAQSRRQIWTFTMPDGSQKVYDTALRLYEPAAIQKLLIDAGFCDFAFYGGVKNEQLTAETPSYAELDQSARRLALWLIDQGIGPENCVGIGIEKSPDYIVALLAIWYCGAAFVPYDPALPSKRLQQIKQESKIKVILDRDNIIEGVKYASPEGAFSLLPASTVLDNLAYVIFTSGSTGLPKGVAVIHKGIVNLLAAQIEAFEFFAGARSLFMLSTNFDASVSDIGCALLSGATLCFESAANLQPGPDFLPLLERRKITHIDCPPSVLSILDCEAAPECLKTIVIGGEVCPAAVVRAWASRVRLVNVYGPTEATICTSLSVCDPITWERALIGQPLPNVDYAIIDDELYIGGICLAREYVNRADLTEQKFPVIDGKRMYRTGDRVRLHADGEIEFLGRIDRQIKMRGLLIEPEEIEARLREHPWVAQAAVLKRQLVDNPSPQGGIIREGLVAFIELKEDAQRLKQQSLRKWLAATLPAWMLPKQWQFVQQLPKTNSGKVDLNALKDFPLNVSKVMQGKALLDNRLIEIIKSILSLNEISLEDNFADLGGDSFAVVELSLAAQMNGIKLTPPVILASATIGAMIEAAFVLNKSSQPSGEQTDVKSAAELRSDIALQADWQKILSTSSSCKGLAKKISENILLTGATGFLGSRLLSELLSQTEAHIHCLVRCTTQESGYRRLSDALNIHGKHLDIKQQKRVTIIPSDLEKEDAGLAKDLWLQLAHEIDTIYHCAALVNMILPYSALRPANLEGSQTIARLLAEGGRKWLHYASTLSVFVSTDRNSGTLYESDDLSETKQIWGGYAQSKWAAEAFLRSLNNAAGNISYYRLGLIVNDADGGKSPKADFLTMFVNGIKMLGCVPCVDRDLFVDVTPVDYAARAMAQLSFADQAENTALTYHIANPRPLHLRELIEAVRRGGAEIEEVSIDSFNEKVKAAVADGCLGPTESAAILALCRIFSTDSFDRMRSFDLFQATDVNFDTRNTSSRLKFGCPSATDWADAVLAGRVNC